MSLAEDIEALTNISMIWGFMLKNRVILKFQILIKIFKLIVILILFWISLPFHKWFHRVKSPRWTSSPSWSLVEHGWFFLQSNVYSKVTVYSRSIAVRSFLISVLRASRQFSLFSTIKNNKYYSILVLTQNFIWFYDFKSLEEK